MFCRLKNIPLSVLFINFFEMFIFSYFRYLLRLEDVFFFKDTFVIFLLPIIFFNFLLNVFLEIFTFAAPEIS